MKKFKLIKEYPGSPELNTILTDLDYSRAYGTEISKHPEFWEEVIERDYEILSFSCNNSLSILLELHEDGKYSYKKAKNYSGTGRLTEQECLKDSYYTIHSVKRLSDGEVFTIGDKVNSEIFDKSCQTIFTITIDCTTNNKIQIWVNNNNKSRFWYLENVTKIKQTLFTTEDGVDIYEGDDFYFVKIKNSNSLDFIWEISTPNSSFVYEPEFEKYFSTKKAAEEYIIMNKPCLSINDIINSTSFKFRTIVDELKTKVKIKLK